MPMRIVRRVRRFFQELDHDEPAVQPEAVRDAYSEIERGQLVKDALRSKLIETGYPPGDAVLGRRRTAPGINPRTKVSVRNG